MCFLPPRYDNFFEAVRSAEGSDGSDLEDEQEGALEAAPYQTPARTGKGRELVDLFHCVFWAGDLNYRIDGKRDKVGDVSCNL